jgi:TolB-like protein/predicted Zn-dependent protease
MADISSNPKAVFLSYAREDADAARRIADALRAFGVEVWFDQNELRGGDVWDQMIRSQIRTCALCIPVVSATTQARGEGYFRREWKIAVERMQDMASGVPYLLPVVIDETLEREAAVPEEFLRVQWTRMPRGVPTSQFVDQVRRMLDRPRKGVADAGRTGSTGNADAIGGRAHKSTHLWTTGAIIAVGAAIVAALLIGRKPAPVAPPPPQAAAATPAPVASVNDKSIAVLPFENMSDDKDSGFFADGIHEDILTNLALIREFRVVSRTSVMPYRTTTKSIRQIAQELGVAYILEGSVRREGNRVRVTGQLIHAATDEHVWAQAYDRDLTDIFAIQAELSQQIALALKTVLSPEEKVLIARKPTQNTEAYDLYLRARDVDHHGGATLSDLEKEEALTQRAVELDPSFAAAWGHLARVEALFWFWGFDQSDTRSDKAKNAIDTAARLNPDDPEVIDSLGTYLYYSHRDYQGATAQYERLAALQPNNPTVWASLGLILRRQGRFAESVPQLRKAIQLDPGNISYSRNLSDLLLAGRRYGEYEVEQRRRIGMLPERFDEAFELAESYFPSRGSTAEADQFIAHLSPEQADSPRGLNMRKDWARTKGDWAEAIRLDKLQPYFDEDGTPHYRQAFFSAIAYARAGDAKAARERIGGFPQELRDRLAKEPNNVNIMYYLSGYESLLGHNDEAIRLARKASDMIPESADAVDGPLGELVLAITYSDAGDKDRALRLLAHLARTPYGGFNIYEYKADGTFAPLNDDPRFQAMLADPANNAPLF